MISTLIKVAAGGALGAALRYLSGVAVARLFGVTGFPLGVLAVNVLGSGIMGILFVWLGYRGLAHLNPFLMTGVLGGFTTFSAFSLEAYTLWERGAAAQAALYVGLSVTLSLAALVAGIYLARGAIG
ncbi:fluoride efflux transporter CrcB [Pseudooceanicola sp.]|uniref:fluoride efflux transporter CrcB n=1 Tax=Pseudooceanicola sp. TaxID=1914328 RepID=UPI002625133B|nr:fluoride efflux transporter CrcB [Pseudooceanicola sp.]MDF1856932.1 fluoride efflux transporter CrcB [Pseudooceanicola sp.]